MKALGVGLVLTLSLSACVSMSSLQTARTLEKGKAEWTLGGGTYSSAGITEAINEDDSTGITVETEDLSIPFLEASYRQGINKDWDWGAKVTIIGSIAADAKYSLLEGEKFAMATGIGLGYFSVETEAGTQKSDVTVYDATVPLHASYDFTERFSLYGGPKYVSRFISGSGDSGQANLLGGTVGAKIGNTWGAYVEGTHFTSLSEEFDGTQFNVAFFWDANPMF